jgi:hypothetical protein
MTVLLIALMLVQSATGLLLPHFYRDVTWIAATWYGNDWFTLVVAVPLLSYARIRRARSRPALLLTLGVAGYAIYNYAFYVFGAALNAFFPIYLAGVALGTAVLAEHVLVLDLPRLAGSFSAATPVRLVGGYLVFVAAGLGFTWGAMWVAFAFAGFPTPIDSGVFKVVAALDLLLMIPALSFGGILLWRRRPWGYVIASIAAIQGAMYLAVLTINSAVAVNRSLVPPPGELLLWTPLVVLTTGVAAVLLRCSGARGHG